MGGKSTSGTGAPVAGQFGLLRTRRFLPLFVTQFLGAFNDNVFKNALVILITFSAASGESNAVLVTAAAGIFIAPFFLFSATAGQLADKIEKGLLIRRVKTVEILIMGLGALGFLAGSMTVLLVALFLMGAQSAMFGPLKYGILPQHLRERELIGGNGLIQMATYVAILAGTIVGGVLVAIEGHGPVIVSMAVIALALAGRIASAAIPVAEAPDPGISVDWQVFRQTWRGIAFARESRTVFAAVIGISWFWFIGATYLQLLPSFGREALGGTPAVVTLLLATFSVGIGIGSLMCERLAGGRIELALVPIGAIGITFFSFVPLVLPVAGAADPAFSVDVGVVLANRSNWPALAAFTGIALSGGIYIVPLYALMQARSNPRNRARVVAANNIVNALFMVGSAGFTIALLRSGFSHAGIFAIVGALNLIVAGIVFRSTPEFVERLRARAGLEGG